MPATTTLTPLPYPLASDAPFAHLDLKALAEATTEKLYVECTSGTRPAHKFGRRIYETDTGRTYLSQAGSWVRLLAGLTGGVGNRPLDQTSNVATWTDATVAITYIVEIGGVYEVVCSGPFTTGGSAAVARTRIVVGSAVSAELPWYAIPGEGVPVAQSFQFTAASSGAATTSWQVNVAAPATGIITAAGAHLSIKRVG
jgi:hypothetical protein